jgi:hypothetical protein
MTTTFADYSAQQEARKNIELAVLGHTYALCEALRQNFIEYSIRQHQRAVDNDGIVDVNYVPYHQEQIEKLKQGICGYEFYPETGRKYHKVIMNANGSRSVHCFIDKKTGSVLKSASWKAPAKGERCNLLIIKEREWALKNADWSGGWLYRR